ncbi:MAG: hypothetical protein IJ982_04270 [Fibrobacter sp.]|nr:hypothetical protein [Fibrobacter sp.]
MLEIILPVVILTGIAIVFAILIAVCSVKFAVKTDEKIEEIEMLLSGANCGACGYAGCADFAKALVEGKAEISSCNATSKDNKMKIMGIIGGGEVGEETIVVCACCGGNSCQDKYDYQGSLMLECGQNPKYQDMGPDEFSALIFERAKRIRES